MPPMTRPGISQGVDTERDQVRVSVGAAALPSVAARTTRSESVASRSMVAVSASVTEVCHTSALAGSAPELVSAVQPAEAVAASLGAAEAASLASSVAVEEAASVALALAVAVGSASQRSVTSVVARVFQSFRPVTERYGSSASQAWASAE